MMSRLALWLNNRADYGEAELLMKRALSIDENFHRVLSSTRRIRRQESGCAAS